MKRTEPRPCSADEAVARAKRLINRGGQYILGTGDYRPRFMAARLVDVPWTERDGKLGSDCWGFAFDWCYKVPRHRPGLASGRVPAAYRDQSDVDDDINCNSAIEDALTTQDLFEVVTSGVPEIGDLVVFPTLRFVIDGEVKKFTGHAGITIGTGRVSPSMWDWRDPPYHLLDIAQCKGPNGRIPAVIETDGSLWEHHDNIWPKPAHRTFVLRVKP
jgi:hypothetical protein